MENFVGKICPFCKTEIKEGDAVKICAACGIPHHEECWNQNNGCTTFGCSQQNYQAQGTNPTAVCAKCGNPLGDGQAFCAKCGTPNVAQQTACGKCGAPLEAGQEFCAHCGQKVGVYVDSNVNSAINQFNMGVQKTKAKKSKAPMAIIALVVVAAVVAACVFLFRDKGPDFQKVYNDHCESTWAEVGADGSYLSIDTNPYDEDDNGIAYYEAYTAVKEVNTALGLPDSLISEMGETSGSDGKQSETFDEQGITVTWKYHPDNGLEVTYKKAN